MAGSAATPGADRSARAVALACALVAVLAGSAAAWRWERVTELVDAVPLPRGATLLEQEAASGRQGDTCRWIARVRGTPVEVAAAYGALLATRGWTPSGTDVARHEYTNGDRLLTAAVGQRAHEPDWTRLRLQLRPCHD